MRLSVKWMWVPCVVLLVGACASAPTWKGMSESEIAGWQRLGVDAGTAQEFMKAGLGPKAVEGWHAAGMKSPETILAWHGGGFAVDEAAAWSKQQFSVDQATLWKKEKFTVEQAGKWKAAGFDLDDAIKNREKGLQPIK